MKALLAPDAALIRVGFPKKRTGLMPMIIRVLGSGVFIFALLVLGFSVGCGKKGDPLPPLPTEGPIIKDLRAENRKDGILLSWSIPRIDEKKRRLRFRVLRAEGAVSCKECPEEWKVVAEIPMNSRASARRRGGRMELVDTDVSEGTAYRYLISIEMEPGEIRPPSNTVQIRR